jgi:hypothetical protein
MKRLLFAIACAFILGLPASGAFAQQSASLTLTFTIRPMPLVAEVQPSCQFVVSAGATTADCTASVLVAQPTFEEDGWRMSLAAASIADPRTGSTLPVSALSLVPGSSLSVQGGQPIDTTGGPYLATARLSSTFDSARTILVAEPGFGNGSYLATVNFRLSLPPDAAPGTYVPSWIVGVSNGTI